MKSQRSSSAKARLEAEPKCEEVRNRNEIQLVSSKRRPQSAFEGLGSQKKSQAATRQNAKLTICCVGESAHEKMGGTPSHEISSPKGDGISQQQKSGQNPESKM